MISFSDVIGKANKRVNDGKKKAIVQKQRKK
jgi:hypothetical protein